MKLAKNPVKDIHGNQQCKGDVIPICSTGKMEQEAFRRGFDEEASSNVYSHMFYRRLPTCNCCGGKLDGNCYKIEGQLLCSKCTWEKYGAYALDYMEGMQ